MKKVFKKNTKKSEMTLEKLAVMVANGFNEIHDKFDQVDIKFEQVDKRFDAIDQKLNFINNRIDKFADHERRIVRLERKSGLTR